MKPNLVLIRGIPGSGKTTFARSLGVQDHYEADQWFDQNGGYDASKIKNAHAWCQTMAANALRAGRSCVVANTFVRRWELDFYYRTAGALGVPVVECICHGRWPNTHGVPAEVVRSMAANFEF